MIWLIVAAAWIIMILVICRFFCVTSERRDVEPTEEPEGEGEDE